MRSFFTTKRFRVLLSVWVALVLGIFVAAVSDSGTSPLSSALSFIMSPLESAAVRFADTFNEFNAKFASAKTYSDEASSLREEIADLRSQLVDYERSLHKLRAYEEFLGVKENNPDFSFVPAEIILKDQTDIYGTFTLDRGEADGVTVNCPVIYGDNLVGIVKAVTRDSCTVYTLLHPEVSVSSYEIHTREDCFTKAETEHSLNSVIKVEGFTKNTPVVSGGIICTSGIGGIYPKELIIGTVSEIKINETQLAAYALVEPVIDYSLLTDVFIITDFEGKAQTVNGNE